MSCEAPKPSVAAVDCDGPSHHCLRVENLTANYGEICALDSVSFSSRCGRSVALVGPNGAGKSTLMKTLAGLLPIRQGRVTWREQALAGGNAEIAYLAQRSEVDWNFPLTVRGLVEMGRYPHVGWWRRYSKKDHAVVDSALEAMRLNDLADRQISALSGGQQQRAFVARALAQEAHVLLLDEPFTGLDRPAQDTLVELLHELTAGGRLIMAAHHDLDTVIEIFDEVLLLNRKTIDFGPVEKAFHQANLEACFGSAAYLARQSAASSDAAAEPVRATTPENSTSFLPS